jgi:hypothetical protein
VYEGGISLQTAAKSKSEKHTPAKYRVPLLSLIREESVKLFFRFRCLRVPSPHIKLQSYGTLSYAFFFVSAMVVAI